MPSRAKSQKAAVAAEHDQLAVGDVEHLEHAEDERQPRRGQAVEPAQEQAEEELLGEEVSAIAPHSRTASGPR